MLKLEQTLRIVLVIMLEQSGLADTPRVRSVGLTCQPPLPDVPPQQVPGSGRGVPQLLADRAPQPEVGGLGALRGAHCGIVSPGSAEHYRTQRR